VNWIRQRHAFLAKNESHLVENEDVINRNMLSTNLARDPPVPIAPRDRRHPKNSFNLLWLFGERRVDYFYLLMQLPNGDGESVKDVIGAIQGHGASAEATRFLETDALPAQELFAEADVYVLVWRGER
jgi:hypothetical protein